MKILAKFLYKILGWKLTGELPAATEKYLIIAAPHTSNWDFPIGIIAKFILGYKGNFLGKHTLFKFPFGWLFKALGGHPVDRSKSQNKVDQVVQLFEQNESFSLVIAPEGTRKKVTQWKTGFYYIALKAKVPLVLYAIDFEHKTSAFSAPYHLTGDKTKDFEFIYGYFRNVKGRNPENFYVPEIQA